MNISDKLPNDNVITESESTAFYIIKALAILSVITAHINTPINDSGVLAMAITNFWAAFANTGVVAFFILSGFFYHRKSGDSFEFWKKKLKFTVIPWIIFSVSTYALSCFILKEASLIGYIKWALGFNTWYYYMTMLIVMYIIFRFIGQNDYLLWLCIIVNAAFLVFTTFHKEPVLPFITNFLNVFHWIGFFALGVLMRKYRLDRKIIKSAIPCYICMVLFLIDCVLLTKIKDYTYFNIFAFQYELVFFVILLYLGHFISSVKSSEVQNGLVFIGKNTLFIYLTHMQIVQFIVNRFPNGIVKYAISPFFAILLMSGITFAVKIVAGRILKCGKLLKYIGIN